MCKGYNRHPLGNENALGLPFGEKVFRFRLCRVSNGTEIKNFDAIPVGINVDKPLKLLCVFFYPQRLPFRVIIPFLIDTQIPIIGSPNIMQDAVKLESDAYLAKNLIGLVNVRHNRVIFPSSFKQMCGRFDNKSLHGNRAGLNNR